MEQKIRDRVMNGKFFDLKKEKQDRMINGALKVFALYGYAHASTDEIVREAGISKGLLFHYFESKLGTYKFVYDYCTRFLVLELSSQSLPENADLYDGERACLTALLNCAQTYPYLPLFLLNSRQEEVFEALEVSVAKNTTIREAMDALRTKIQCTEEEPSGKKKRLLTFTIEGILLGAYREKAFQASMILEQVEEYIEYLREHFR